MAHWQARLLAFHRLHRSRRSTRILGLPQPPVPPSPSHAVLELARRQRRGPRGGDRARAGAVDPGTAGRGDGARAPSRAVTPGGDDLPATAAAAAASATAGGPPAPPPQPEPPPPPRAEAPPPPERQPEPEDRANAPPEATRSEGRGVRRARGRLGPRCATGEAAARRAARRGADHGVGGAPHLRPAPVATRPGVGSARGAADGVVHPGPAGQVRPQAERAGRLGRGGPVRDGRGQDLPAGRRQAAGGRASPDARHARTWRSPTARASTSSGSISR